MGDVLRIILTIANIFYYIAVVIVFGALSLGFARLQWTSKRNQFPSTKPTTTPTTESDPRKP